MDFFGIQRLAVWSGVAAITLFTLGFLLAHFIPPASPAWTVDHVVAHYQAYANGIRAGGVTMMISGMFMCPLVGVISAQLRRIPAANPVLVYAQISAGTLNAVFFMLGALIFVLAAYRPDRSPDTTFLLNDAAWIFAVLPWPPAFMQNCAIALAILSDRSARPVFPRWVAYFNFWVAIGFLPGGLLPFAKSGPIAWSGVLVFWLAGGVFILWFIVMTIVLFRVVRAQQADQAHRPAHT